MTTEKTPIRIARQSEVCARTGLARNTIWKRVKAGQFPAPIDLGCGRIGWIASEFDAWLAGRPRVFWAPDGEDSDSK